MRRESIRQRDASLALRLAAMAIYHLSAQVLGRAKGASAVAAAAYRAAARLSDERTGERHDYSRRGGVDHAEIVAPESAPEWVRDRGRLWNAAERAERHPRAQVAREVRVAIPAELNRAEARELVREFAREQFAARGMVADVAWHGADSENPHAHVLLTMRPLDGERFAARKERAWNSKDVLLEWRKGWEEAANRALERAGREERIDCRTLRAQREEALRKGDREAAERLDREPTLHLGRSAVHMEAKGVESERVNRHFEIEDRNEERAYIREQLRFLNRLREQLQVIRGWRRGLRDLRERLRRAAGRRWLIERWRRSIRERLRRVRILEGRLQRAALIRGRKAGAAGARLVEQFEQRRKAIGGAPRTGPPRRTWRPVPRPERRRRRDRGGPTR